MKITQPMKARYVVGRGSTQLLFESSFDVKPPMSTTVGESYEVEVTNYTAFNDRVLIKGTLNKTLYYKHPHGQKGNTSNSDKEAEKQQENSNTDSTTSTTSQKFLSKIKRRKGKNSQQKEQAEETSKQKSSDKNQQNKNEQSEQNDSASNQLACLCGSGQIVESTHGIVHFHQQALEFSGTVEIPGVKPGDSIHVTRVEGSTFEPLVTAAAANENNNGLINAATHTFAVDVELVATRSKAEKHTSKKERSFKSLPLNNQPTAAK